jgi:outer membrane protein assembly factor BamB
MQITSADLAIPGSALITVNDPTGTGRTSNPVSFTVGSSLDAVAPQITMAHSGVINFPSVSLPSAASWTVTLPGPPSYATITAGQVFVTVPVSAGSQLYAFDQATGAPTWGPIIVGAQASLTYDSATLFVLTQTTELGVVEALNPLTGTSEWFSPLLGYSFSSGIVAGDGLVFPTSATGLDVLAVSESSGAVVWTAQVENGEDCTPAFTPNGLFVAYPDHFSGFNPATGTLLWADNGSIEGGGGAMPVAANGLLYAASGLITNPNTGAITYGGSILNGSTGAPQGTYAADTIPAIGPQMGYFLQSGVLNAINASNTVIWSFQGDGELVTAPLAINQYVVIGSSGGNLYVLDSLGCE